MKVNISALIFGEFFFLRKNITMHKINSAWMLTSVKKEFIVLKHLRLKNKNEIKIKNRRVQNYFRQKQKEVFFNLYIIIFFDSICFSNLCLFWCYQFLASEILFEGTVEGSEFLTTVYFSGKLSIVSDKLSKVSDKHWKN